MRQCEIILSWSDEDPAFIVEVAELPGCMAHGNVQELGRPVPEPKGERLMFA